LVPTLSCLMSNSYQTHHFNSMIHLIQLSYSHHDKTHQSQLIHHLIHKGYSVHNLKGNTHSNILSTFEIKENTKANHPLTQLLTQTEGSRPGEEDPRSGELPSPRRELDFQYSGSPGRPFMKNNLGELLLISPRRDQLAWASLSVLATVFTCSRHIGIPQTTIPPYRTSIPAGKLKQSQTT